MGDSWHNPQTVGKPIVWGFFMKWEHLLLVGPVAIVALAVLLKLLRTYIVWARKNRSKPPDLKIYRPEADKPRVYDPPLPPGFDPGYGYDFATPEQKQIQAQMAWEVYNAEKEGRTAVVQIHTNGKMTIGDETRPVPTTECPRQVSADVKIVDARAYDPIAQQKRLDQAEAEKAGTLADTVQPMSPARTEDLIAAKKAESRENEASIRAMVIAEAEKMLGEERIKEKRAELGEEGYARFLDDLVSSVQQKSRAKSGRMAQALLGRGGTVQDEADLMRGLGFRVPAEPPHEDDRPGV